MATEGYVFVALVYWIFCFAMSRYSLSIEEKLKQLTRDNGKHNSIKTS